MPSTTHDAPKDAPMADPYYADRSVTVWAGDCLDVLPTLPDNSVDCVVTDPPYDLTSGKRGGTGEASLNLNSPAGRSRISTGGFMGKSWDATGVAFEPETWQRVLRVMKPGAHLLAFGGTRTWHRLTCAIEDAGFEIRDSIAWLYGSGFPKSRDVSKAIDAEAGAVREVVGRKIYADGKQRTSSDNGPRHEGWQRPWREEDPDRNERVTAPATPEAAQWQGWGTALKPAFEPVAVARKPLVGTVAANVLRFGTGALNIDATRIEHASAADLAESQGKNRHADFDSGPRENRVYGSDNRDRAASGNYDGASGRWPANVCLDESQAAALDQMSGELSSHDTTPGGQFIGPKVGEVYDLGYKQNMRPIGRGDSGGASRFFYTAHDDQEEQTCTSDSTEDSTRSAPTARPEPRLTTGQTPSDGFESTGTTYTSLPIDRLTQRFTYTAKAGSEERITHNGVSHPTVKPLSLMRWLVRLVCPPGGVILDPFAGSGTTAEACLLEGFRCIAVEREADYLPMITQRINRRRDPIAYITAAGEDLGLFGGEPHGC